jgi:hypothetical protein
MLTMFRKILCTVLCTLDDGLISPVLRDVFPILSGKFPIVKRILDEFSGTAAFLLRIGSRWRTEWNLAEGWAHAAAYTVRGY